MTVEQAQELSRLAGLWATSRVRRALVMHGCGARGETKYATEERERKANADFHQYLRSLIGEDQNLKPTHCSAVQIEKEIEMKVVINACRGGFGLSEKAVMRYAELKGLTLYPERQRFYTTYWLVPEGEWEDRTNFHTWPLEERQASIARRAKQTLDECAVPRDDPALVQVVEELGADANGHCSDLAIVEIPDGVAWQIEEYDGLEHVAEKHRVWPSVL